MPAHTTEGWRPSRDCQGRAQRRSSAPSRGGEPHGGIDLDLADRDALDVEPERDPHPPAERDQVDGRRDRLLIGGVEGVVGMTQLVLDPARDGHAEPPEELQGLERSAD